MAEQGKVVELTDAQILVGLLHPRLVELGREMQAVGETEQAAGVIEAALVMWETAHEVNPGSFRPPPFLEPVARVRAERKVLLGIVDMSKEV